MRRAPGTKVQGFASHDPRLEFLRRMADVAGEFAVPLAMADDQQQVLPALRDEVLDQSVGQHRPARQQMQDVGAAIFAAQAIICRAGVEKRDPRGLRHSGDRQQLRRRQIGHDQPDALCRKLAQARGEIALLRHDPLGQGEGLPGKAAGRVIVGNAEPRALDAFILRRLVEIGERQSPLDRAR